MRDDLLHRITRFYLESAQFNGHPLQDLLEGADKEEVLRSLQALVTDGYVAIVFGDGHENPHIRALPEHHSPEEQVELLNSLLADQACVYPLPKHLEAVVDKSEYAGKPYMLALALGHPQLTHRAFDMMVLETYRNDPRYYYDSDDIQGLISVRDEHYLTGGAMQESDKVLLQTFGFAYDDALNKYVAVFLGYLSRLSPEHQTLWHIREIGSKTFLHPDYHRMSMGHWPERISIYQAFMEEIAVVNQMARAMGRPQFFLRDYSGEERPPGFGSLLRPTRHELADFVQLLDQLMSDNINKKFFRDEVADSEERERPNGVVEVRQIGTIRMLETWLDQFVRAKDRAQLTAMLEAFRKVRKLRQKPAHVAIENRFEQSCIHEQRELIVEAYTAVRTLRLLFANHPLAKDVEVSDFLRNGQVWEK